MKLLRGIFFLTLCFPLFVVKAQQPATKSTAQGTDFLIDSTKPYVYLELDHLGARKPLRASEPNIGLWLRLKNNCKLPIVIMALGAPPNGDGEVLSLADEVVPNPQRSGDGLFSGVITPKGLEEMTDIFRWPNMTEEEVRSAEHARSVGQNINSKNDAERPYGYNGGYEPVAPILTVIPPGGQILFSLPANHVSESWHVEIPFRFALPNKSKIRPPYNYVAFYQEDTKDARVDAATPTH